MRPRQRRIGRFEVLTALVVLSVLFIGGLAYGQEDPSQTDSVEILPPPAEGERPQTGSDEVSPGVHKEVEEAAHDAGLDEGATQQLQSKVAEVVEAGVPQGIALEVVKKGLDRGLNLEEMLQALDDLKAEVESGTPPGKAKQQVLGDAESEGGEASDGQDSSEAEDEENGQGPPDNPGNNGDKDENKGENKDNGDDKGQGPPENPGNGKGDGDPGHGQGPPDDPGKGNGKGNGNDDEDGKGKKS